MDFIERLESVASRVEKQVGNVETEEATKNALVMPFIGALGYDVFNPAEVVPEFTADIGTKKGEKVDYAIMQDGQPIILFECKTAGTNLDEASMSQLYRYFATVEARVGILTDGVNYQLYSDLEEPNKMDDRPFLEFSLTDLQDSVAGELKRLTKDKFDHSEIVEAAGELKLHASAQTSFQATAR